MSRSEGRQGWWVYCGCANCWCTCCEGWWWVGKRGKCTAAEEATALLPVPLVVVVVVVVAVIVVVVIGVVAIGVVATGAAVVAQPASTVVFVFFVCGTRGQRRCCCER